MILTGRDGQFSRENARGTRPLQMLATAVPNNMRRFILIIVSWLFESLHGERVA